MSDKFGRRLPILVCLFGNSLCLIWTGFAPTMWQLILARGMAGLFAGTQSVCSAYGKSRSDFVLAFLKTIISVGSYDGGRATKRVGALVCSGDFWFDFEKKENGCIFHFCSAKGFIAGPAIGIAIGLSFGIERIQLAFRVTCLAAALIAGEN
jgi:MFS family permease